jgi:hypothetical protein
MTQYYRWALGVTVSWTIILSRRENDQSAGTRDAALRLGAGKCPVREISTFAETRKTAD